MSSGNETLDAGPSSKKQRIDDAANDAIPNGPMKITDIEIKCLEKVFKYLDMNDLFNLAEANTWLRRAVQQVYKEKSISKVKMLHNEGRRLSVKDEELRVNGLETQLRFLRYFGHLITSLAIDYDQIAENCRTYMDQYINVYCADTLIELCLWGADESVFEELKKPFKQIESVSVCAWQMPNLDGQLFPKCIALELDCDGEDDSDLQNIENFIQSSPQLKSLCIATFLNEDICQSISNLTALETFGINLTSDCFKYFDYDGIDIHLENVKKFIILAEPFRFDCNPYDLVTFDRLEEVEFADATIEFYSSDTLEFFSRHPTIKKLTIRGTYSKPPMKDDELAVLKKSLPSLIEVNVNGRTVSIDEISDFQRDLASGCSNTN